MSVTTAQTQTLLAALILVAGVAALVWTALAWTARIAPRASLTMACANAANALSLTLHVLRGTLPDAFTYWPSDVLAVASFALLGAAVPAITTRELPWKPAAAAVAACALALLALPYGGDLRWQARLISAAAAGLTLMAGLTAWRSLGRSASGRRTPAPLALPLFLIAALMALRCAESFANPGATPDLRLPTGFNLVFLWTGLVLLLLQNATLAFLVLMRLILRIERLLERDPLTDTLNRRAFDQALASAHAWLARGRGYALVMIDMDRFKQLNDSLGHAAGDAALRQMVKELQPCLREVDRFGRLGGEEFCVLLPDTDIAGAALVAERMRCLIDAAPLRWLEQDWPLSASFGIAEAERGDTGADAVLARADAALYRAKHQGRNLVQG
ncbi:sensor domain-containing diguanylate cyclase [Roseateles saccharophilus]|uniref:diguanylate cyclase n=1 Tax=Roseateles saccharophilus TaxID=304 RepID=A0A4R3UFK9_ROSSA|nr:GGDEF domain-containing protein [Roseateles saccharophilus]TCU88977.1 diguanylate cyclase (GGDEF)-like protein [Roseateles saccharophilus]